MYYTYDKSYTEDNDNNGTGETVYYYRGAVTNNYLVFAGFCWRVVRTNEDGSVKLRYGGIPATTDEVISCPQTGTDVKTTVMAFNGDYTDNRYVGYMYGSTCTSYATCHANDVASPMKTYLESWYTSNLSDYDSQIADTPYCSDRTISQGNTYSGISNGKTGSGTGVTFYGAAGRLVGENSSAWVGGKTDGHPTYKCTQNSDKFTLSSTTGNGENTKPIGLLTMDEASYAGGEWYNGDGSSNNTTYYLYTSQWYWTMSPISYYSTYSIMGTINETGYLGHITVNNTSGRVLPVISLKSTVTVNTSSDGTYNNPYIVQ